MKKIKTMMKRKFLFTMKKYYGGETDPEPNPDPEPEPEADNEAHVDNADENNYHGVLVHSDDEKGVENEEIENYANDHDDKSEGEIADEDDTPSIEQKSNEQIVGVRTRSGRNLG